MINLRNVVFHLLDHLKGGKVNKHYKDIKIKLASTSKQENQLLNLLSHAVVSTNFYSHYDPTDLSSFPVINKTVIKSKTGDFISKEHNQNELISVITSGSTGTPFQVFHDINKKNRNSADTLYFSQLGGYTLGNRLFYLKIWAQEKMASPFHYFLKNIVPVDVVKLDDKRIIDLIYQIKEYKGRVSMLGYVSAFESLCKYLDRNNYPPQFIKVESIITMSESLDDYTKDRLEYYFGVKPLSRYSNLENGILAQQTNVDDHKYLINTASYKVEILNIKDDNPVGFGKTGRIVVTDLYNYAMPMIRYDTGDYGVFSNDSDNKGNLFLEKVEGRKLDVLYDVDGQMVSSYIMYKNMWKYMEIDQYQLIQKDSNSYLFKISIVGNKPFKHKEKLKKEFLQYLGHTANFDIEYVDEIPLLDSGKRRKVVNLMK
jgi:phenylacetate-CoA ligase